MQGWIEKRIDNASWTRLGVFLLSLLAYSFWLFRPGGRYMQAKDTARILPEELFGFKDGEPARAFSQLFGLKSDYMLFQAMDIPYAILNFFALSAIFGLALKKFRLDKTLLRYLMLLPVVYLAAEFIENTLLVILAGGDGGPGALVPIQQAATTIKLGVGFPSSGLAFLLLLALGVSLIIHGFSALLKRN